LAYNDRYVISSSRISPRVELAQFLKSRRARVRPADVGFPDGARRRTPGLRREEVARLADVGVSWYTWLEQGRDIHVSEPLLERLARALLLTASERAYLFELAQGRPAARPTIAPSVVSDALRRVIDAHPYPAFVSTLRRDFLALNEPAKVLYGDILSLPVEQRNGLWSFFMNMDRRKQVPDWENTARAAVATFRLDAARAADRTEFDALAVSLSNVSPDFARFWNDHDVIEVTEGTKEFLDAEHGKIEFELVTLAHSEPDGRTLRVILYSPKQGKSTERANKLFKR
jgi:transcriptional regulator with XRE-family HTH domain